MTAPALRSAGFSASDVRDVGLRGRNDSDICAYAVSHGFVLVTGDLGFANPFAYPPEAHAGIVVVRVPNEISTQRINDELLRALVDLDGEDIRESTVIVELGRTRIRRLPNIAP